MITEEHLRGENACKINLKYVIYNPQSPKYCNQTLDISFIYCRLRETYSYKSPSNIISIVIIFNLLRITLNVMKNVLLSP